MRTAGIASVILITLAGTAHAGGGFVPPMRVDMGAAFSESEHDLGGQVVAGIHWASLYPKKTYLDVGLGFVSTSFGGPEDPPTMHASSRPRVRDPLSIFAGYVEVATRPSGNGWWRTWVGTRVEAGQGSRDGDDQGMIGVAVRASAELWIGGASSGSGSGMMGVGAIGLYGEMSARRFVDDSDDLGASVGLSFRVPLIAAN